MSIENEVSEQEIDLDYALGAAIKLHQTDQLDEAEAVYRIILDQFPKCPEALHFFGLLMHQRGDNDAAIRTVDSAIQKNTCVGS